MFSKQRLPLLLLGIGIGVILTNIIYTFNPSIEYREYSEAEIVEKATDLGMVFVKDNIQVLPVEEKDQVEEAFLEENDEDKEKVEEIEFSIEYGDSLIRVSKKLYQAGIIDDEDEFVEFAKNKGVDKKLRVGTYKLSPKYDYETIIKIILKQK